jgi:hypothetical protein
MECETMSENLFNHYRGWERDGLCYHGFHRVAIHIERVSPVFYRIAQGHSFDGKIAKRFNANSHVCNAWGMITIVGSNLEKDGM